MKYDWVNFKPWDNAIGGKRTNTTEFLDNIPVIIPSHGSAGKQYFSDHKLNF
jgi:hypothetical protein